MTLALSSVWAALIAFAVFAYVMLDGFDLGIGILFPALAAGDQRDQAMNSVAPVWDGNETWLVLGGGGLFAAFPLAFSVMMPAFYLPIIVMLLSLVFRGTAFEFRWRSRANRRAWDWAFALGSFFAALCQGVVLGGLLQGVAIEGRSFAGHWSDCLTPFTLLCGLSVVAGYALLGACWLVLKTEQDLQERAYRLAALALPAVLLAILAVSAATPFLDPRYWHRWMDFPAVLVTAQVPLAVAITALLLLRGLRKRREARPFPLALTLFGLCFLGLGISFYPDIIPGRLSIEQAASPDSSLAFMLVGAGLLLPVILAYTGYSYWVFRGKVQAGGYH